MKTVYHQAFQRGQANYGWLHSFHSFSFANYYAPDRMGFGALRVINDDTVIGGAGFGNHPHRDMEIISIPLSGSLLHKDNMGNEFTIKRGEVQIMSAGTGVQHSEYNASKTEKTNFLQIWIYPDQKGLKPSYGQKSFPFEECKNELLLLLSPEESDEALKINQNTRLYFGQLDKDKELVLNLGDEHRGHYIFSLSGEINIEGIDVHAKDGLGIWDGENKDVTITAQENASFLVFDLPM